MYGESFYIIVFRLYFLIYPDIVYKQLLRILAPHSGDAQRVADGIDVRVRDLIMKRMIRRALEITYQLILERPLLLHSRTTFERLFEKLSNSIPR